jgi:hypothetical protein
MKTTLLVSIVGASALFLTTGCEDKTSLQSPVLPTPVDIVPADVPAGLVPDDAAPASVPLKVEFPPELIEGTPKPMPVPNLMPLVKKGPVVHVPAGTTLLSRGKTVTSSDDWPIIGTLDLVTDGDKEAGGGYYLELADGLQWIQIDLEESATIRVIWIWRDHSQRKAAHDVIVQVSDDPEFQRGVTTVFNNDYDNSTSLGIGRDRPYVESCFGKPVDGRNTRGRYLRLYSNGSTYEDGNRYIEVEVYGVIR